MQEEIDLSTIEDENLRKVVRSLMNLVEELSTEEKRAILKLIALYTIPTAYATIEEKEEIQGIHLPARCTYMQGATTRLSFLRDRYDVNFISLQRERNLLLL